MGKGFKWDETVGILLFAVSLGLLGVSVFLCFSSDIWYDELFTMGLANQSCGGLVSITAQDVHPPLYYLIVKLFLTVFGGGSDSQVVIAKLVSVLPFFFCLLYALFKVRKRFGMLAAGIFSFLILSMPRMADYTVEVRMYGFALFFVTAGMLHACELAHAGGKKGKIDRNWIALSLYALAACYTHYFACVAACMIYLYLLAALISEGRLKKEGKYFLISGLFCALGYLPWLLTVVIRQVGQVRENYWIQPLTWRSLGGCIKFLFMPSFSNAGLNVALAAALFVCYGALFVLFLKKGMRRNLFLCGCVGVLAGVVLFGFLASFLIRPIFVYRYMLPALGVFWLALAVMAAECKNKKIIFIPLMLLLLTVGLRNYRAFYGEEMWKRVQMKGAQEALLQIREEDIVVCNFDQTQAVATYYLPNETYLWYGEPERLICEMYPRNHALVEQEFSDEAGIAALEELLRAGKTVWFIGSGNARDEIVKKWENSGIGSEEKASAMVERYWFNLYRIFLKNE